MLVAPDSGSRAAVLLFHDAFGLGEIAIEWAHQYAALGYTVFAADMWGGKLTPEQHQIGGLIGGMVADRNRWHERAALALETARSQPEVLPERIIAVGYCFGGSTALELLRVGAELSGVVSVHGGLDLMHDDWGRARGGSSALICTGADDPMATSQQVHDLTDCLTSAGVDWQLHLYSGTKHAFTNPALEGAPPTSPVAYNAKSASRAWHATVSFLDEQFSKADAGASSSPTEERDTE